MKRKTNVGDLNDVFQVVRVSSLMENDDIFSYIPTDEEVREIRENIIKAIKSGIPDFRAQVKPPVLGKDGELCYTEGSWTYGHNLIWWSVKSAEIWPEKNSRIGTPQQRYAFLGCLIKELHDEYDYTVEKAWEAVCISTKKIENYKGVWLDLDALLITLDREVDAILFGGNGETIASSRKAGWWTAFEGFSFGEAWVVCDCD